MTREQAKYICVGGFVISKTDGGKHYISAHRLSELYNVPKNRCVFVDNGRELHGIDLTGWIILLPRQDGIYIPEYKF